LLCKVLKDVWVDVHIHHDWQDILFAIKSL
jgi:hypothetical protein